MNDVIDQHATDEVEAVSAAHRRAVWVLVGLVVVAGALLRILLLRSAAGAINADEAYTGIESFEILAGHFPLTLGGTVYTLPFEAYLYAPIAAAVGTNVIALKLLSTLSWALTSIVIFSAAERVSTRRAGLLAAAFCWVTPGALLIISVTAYSGYSSGMLAAVCCFYLAIRIVDAVTPNPWVTALFGALAGFGFWLHPMFLAVLFPIVGTVLVVHRRHVATWLTVIGGAIVGCSPLLLWNAVNSWPSLETPADVEGTYVERLRTFAADLVPRAFGLRDGNLDWLLPTAIALVVYVVFIGVAVYGTVAATRSNTSRSRVLLPVVLVAAFPIMALFANLIYANDGRYGIIAFPFVVIAVAGGVDALAQRGSTRAAPFVFVAAGLIWVGCLVIPTVSPLLDDASGNPNGDLETVVELLGDAGIERVYGSYWVSLPVEFMGDRQLVGGVFPGWPIRFPERQWVVGSTPPEGTAVVFNEWDEDTNQLLMPAERYERVTVGNMVVYIPKAAPAGG